MTLLNRWGLGLAVMTLAGGAPGAAQASACSYIRCFLRIERHPGMVVQGAAATPVAHFGFSAPRIDMLSSPDSARRQYAAFRSAYNRGRTLQMIGVALGLTGFALASTHPRSPGPGVGITLVGAAVGLASFIPEARAWRHLEAALVVYNRSLPDGP